MHTEEGARVCTSVRSDARARMDTRAKTSTRACTRMGCRTRQVWAGVGVVGVVTSCPVQPWEAIASRNWEVKVP